MTDGPVVFHGHCDNMGFIMQISIMFPLVYLCNKYVLLGLDQLAPDWLRMRPPIVNSIKVKPVKSVPYRRC